MTRQVLTPAEFRQEMESLKGCTVESVGVEPEGLICLTLSGWFRVYKIWTPVLDHDELGTIPLGVERHDDEDGDPTILECSQ